MKVYEGALLCMKVVVLQYMKVYEGCIAVYKGSCIAVYEDELQCMKMYCSI